jgi:hypothetical protein
VSRRPRRPPERGPEEEGQARPAGCAPRERQRHAPARPDDDRPIAPRGDQLADLALVDEAVWHGGRRRAGRCAVLVAPAVERELDPGQRVQALEGDRTVGRHVPGDEQHGLHRAASS